MYAKFLKLYSIFVNIAELRWHAPWTSPHQARQVFTLVVDEMPPKTRLAGEALFQRALCLDSMGKSEEAIEEYKVIVRHPAADIAKRARMMLDGFQYVSLVWQSTVMSKYIHYGHMLFFQGTQLLL